MIKHKELIKTYKSPLYIYDGTIIKRQYQKLTNAFSLSPNFKINYAIKALSSLAILQLIKSLGANVDAVSIGEIKLALLAGFSPEQISFTPNGVPFTELEEAIALGVHLTLDNLEQIYRYNEKYNKPIAIRIKPNIKAGGNEKIAVGHKNSKFGIPLYQIKEITTLIETKKLTVDGLHLHTGSDILDAQSFLDAAEVLFETAPNFNDLKFLDFGSGFKVKYKPNDYETDIADLGTKLSNRFKEFNKNYNNDLTLIIEPGKFLVSESGQFLTTVSTIKKTNDKQFAFVDAGLNQLIRPMLYDAYHHIINISNPEGKTANYDVVGYICETDTFASEQAITQIKTGDILAFQNAGAYAFTMASNYNSRLRPAEILCIDGKCQLIRKRETFEDLTQNQIY
jgi:diaminopimelate decarboxylase